MRWKPLAPLAALALALCACAPQARLPQVESGQVNLEAKKQKELALRDFAAKAERLERVSWAVLAANAELCGETVAWRPGLMLGDLQDFKKEQRDVAASALGLGEGVQVHFVVPGGPAAAAGLAKGDRLREVFGMRVERRRDFGKAAEKALAAGAAIPVVVERGGERLERVITPAKLCRYPTQLVLSSTLNAYADGKGIKVMTAMLKFVQTDDELAAIVGHELAHNTQGHIRAKTANAILGTLLVDLPVAILTGVNPNVGGNIGRMAYSQEYEKEADYVGLYYTARAGYGIAQVPDIWRRMAIEQPGAISMGSTHPSTSERFVALEAAAAEIEGKRTAGLPLRPAMKDDPEPGKPDAKPDVKTDAKAEAGAEDAAPGLGVETE